MQQRQVLFEGNIGDLISKTAIFPFGSDFSIEIEWRDLGVSYSGFCETDYCSLPFPGVPEEISFVDALVFPETSINGLQFTRKRQKILLYDGSGSDIINIQDFKERFLRVVVEANSTKAGTIKATLCREAPR